MGNGYSTKYHLLEERHHVYIAWHSLNIRNRIVLVSKISNIIYKLKMLNLLYYYKKKIQNSTIKVINIDYELVLELLHKIKPIKIRILKQVFTIQ